MHTVIRAVVYAKTKEDALDKARSVFERLVENQNPFDYYQMFDNEGTSVSGKGRWGNLPAAVKTTTKAGKKLIDEGMTYTRNEFNEAINAIREAVNNYDNKQLFEDKEVKANGMVGMFRYYCGIAGSYRGSSVWLYDDDGEGILNEKQLEDVLSKYQCIYDRNGQVNPHKDESIWVVPADVHY
jgi:hypothetical protein